MAFIPQPTGKRKNEVTSGAVTDEDDLPLRVVGFLVALHDMGVDCGGVDDDCRERSVL